MARPVDPSRTIEKLVDHMFDQVFADAERTELLTWIRRWDIENPDVDAAHRLTGWIDVAYAFQMRRTRPVTPVHDEPVGRLRPVAAQP